jgi:hypothetical protein
MSFLQQAKADTKVGSTDFLKAYMKGLEGIGPVKGVFGGIAGKEVANQLDSTVKGVKKGVVGGGLKNIVGGLAGKFL